MRYKQLSSLVEDLQKIRDQIAIGWCVGAFARDKNGRAVSTSSHTAKSWCLVGAAELHGLYDYDDTVLLFIRERLPHLDLSEWNDQQPNQETVLVKLDKIIEEAKRL